MPKITLPFLPRSKLIQYMQTQCETDADGKQSAVNGALDLDVSHLDAHAAVARVAITHAEIQTHRILVCYDVHYRIFNGCTGVDIRSYLDKKVYGSKSANGWEFEDFAMPAERSTVDEF